jgi:pimeloyl-ACP methyl ester carboxylesterase
MRAAIQFCRVEDPSFRSSVTSMERRFQEGARLIGAPLEAVEVPFEGKSLAGYYLCGPSDGKSERPTLLMVGGGDTFREDLFYFAGLPSWKRGYDCLMVDLPGQGMMPDRGFNFRVDMYAPQKACLDYLAERRGGEIGRLAVYGVSGGGYVSAQLAAADRRVSAWIAATPIYDMGMIFRKEFGAAMRAPGWLLDAAMKAAGRINRVAEVNLGKYAWQFGTADFKSAFEGAIREAVAVDLRRITCPSLFLVSEGEGIELKRQATAARDTLARKGVDARLVDFTVAEGADAHCEINNLRLAHARIFDWLDSVFSVARPDPRLLA